VEDDIIAKANIGGARKQARGLLKTAKVTQAPILIKNLLPTLREQFDIAIVQTNGLPSKCDAITTNIDGKITISCNSSKPITRRKFSAAHELGHLHMGHVHSGGRVDYRSTNLNETEANAFAAELIMPLDMLKKDIAGKVNGIKEMAIRYEVSEEAMGWRLVETNLFKKM
jgi:Zn-dependent peptidase ImmA (M78 family)